MCCKLMKKCCCIVVIAMITGAVFYFLCGLKGKLYRRTGIWGKNSDLKEKKLSRPVNA